MYNSIFQRDQHLIIELHTSHSLNNKNTPKYQLQHTL